MAKKIELDGIELMKAIANKNQDPDTAKKSFYLFVSAFEGNLLKYAEIHANKVGFSIDTAFEGVQCAFAKVWKYPSFDMTKANCKDPNKAILIWLQRIATSQMYDYASKNRCADLTPEEDLSVIEDATSFVEIRCQDKDVHEKIELVNALENRISCLDEKHRIIFLTYMAYESIGKRLPRRLLKKLRLRLDIAQTTIRVYKKQAYEKMRGS